MFANHRSSQTRLAVSDSIRAAGCRAGDASFKRKRRRNGEKTVRIGFSGGLARLENGFAAMAACSSADSSFALGILRVTACGGSYKDSLYCSPQAKTATVNPNKSTGIRQRLHRFVDDEFTRKLRPAETSPPPAAGRWLPGGGTRKHSCWLDSTRS